MKSSAGEYAIGIDLGGTKIAAGIIDFNGKIRAKTISPTEAHEGGERVIQNIFETVAEVLHQAQLKKKDILGIGIGAPGPLSAKKGVIISAPTLGWENMPLRDMIQAHFGLPALLDNDANVAGQAELWYGAAQGAENLIYLTVSTGIGGGIIINKKIYRGSTDFAGEIGCITVKEDGPLCSCGHRGCLEALSSGTAIARKARELIRSGVKSMILDLAGGDPDKITAVMVAEADRKGDLPAREVLDGAIKYLSIGIANLINIFNPDAIVIGGGVSKLGDRLFVPLSQSVMARALKAPAEHLKILPSKLGEDAGMIGAATLVTEAFQFKRRANLF